MTDSESYQVDDARLVGHEWQVKLAFVTEYEFSLVAGHEREDVVEDATELALFGDQKKSDRFLLHSETEPVRDIYEDDVDAEEIRWIDGPTAPSENTYWDDRVHFDDRYVDTGSPQDGEPITDGGQSSESSRCECEHVDGDCAYCKRRKARVPDPGVMFPW